MNIANPFPYGIRFSRIVERKRNSSQTAGTIAVVKTARRNWTRDIGSVGDDGGKMDSGNSKNEKAKEAA